MVVAGHALADAVLHEPRQRGQDGDGGIGPALEELAVEDDLPLGDVAREVGDRVRDVVVGHGQDGDLRDGARGALDPSRPLVERGQIGVEIARVALARGDLAPRGRDLAQGLAVVGHVRKDDEDVHAHLVGQVLGGREGASRRDEPLDGGAVGEGEEHHDAGQDARALEGVDEEARDVVLDAHPDEDDGERLGVARAGGRRGRGEYLRLPDDLGREPVMRQAVARENRQLLPADQGVHPVDGRDARLDEVPRIDSGRSRFADGTLEVQQVDLPERGR